jgi:hypothetical protein
MARLPGAYSAASTSVSSISARIQTDVSWKRRPRQGGFITGQDIDAVLHAAECRSRPDAFHNHPAGALAGNIARVQHYFTSRVPQPNQRAVGHPEQRAVFQVDQRLRPTLPLSGGLRLGENGVQELARRGGDKTQRSCLGSSVGQRRLIR